MDGIEEIFGLEGLTPQWMTRLLDAAGKLPGDGEVVAIETVPFGTGQSGISMKIGLAYRDAAAAGPASLIVKFASKNADARAFANATGMYEREVRSNRELASLVPVPVPAAIHAARTVWGDRMREAGVGEAPRRPRISKASLRCGRASAIRTRRGQRIDGLSGERCLQKQRRSTGEIQ